jgi:hypothetical protein
VGAGLHMRPLVERRRELAVAEMVEHSPAVEGEDLDIARMVVVEDIPEEEVVADMVD